MTRMILATPKLPPEIWAHILNFLPARFVQTLYPVNSVLFHIASSVKHKIIVFDSMERRKIENTILNPNANRRARRFTIRNYCQHPKLDEALAQTEYLVHEEQSEDAVLEEAHSLSRIQEAEVDLAFSLTKEDHFKLRFMRTLLDTSSNQISFLSLNCALNEISSTIKNLVLPELSALHLNIRASDEYGWALDSAVLLPLVQGFLVRHVHSIKDFHLYFHESIDPSAFLHDLPQFSALLKIRLSFYVCAIDDQRLSGINLFLAKHRLQLRGVDIDIRPNHVPIHTALVAGAQTTFLEYPHLSEMALSINHRSMRNDINAASAPFVHQYRLTLESLQLHSAALTLPDLQEVFSGVFPKLKRLAIISKNVSMQHLTHLAQAVPVLEELVLNIIWQAATFSVSPAVQGLPDVATILSSWTVWSLNIIPTLYLRQMTQTNRAAIASVLPRVHSFCEVGRAEYAASEIDPGVSFGDQEYWGKLVHRDVWRR